MIKSSAVHTGAVRTECCGNLALAPTYTGYRVLEGGHSKDNHRPLREGGEAHDLEVCSRSNCRVVRTRQAQAASIRTTMLVMATTALLIAILSLVWQLPDIVSARRVQQALQDASYQTVVVHTGDTLWGIAQDHAVSGCSTEDLVNHIRDINHINDARLQVGMQLNVPCG